MKKRNVKSSFNIFINGDVWKIKFYSRKVYDKLYPDAVDAKAFVEFDKKIIVFRTEEFKRSVVIHETVHAYDSYLCLEDVDDITPDQMSEIMATFIQRNKSKIDRTVNQIMSLYRSIHV